MDASTALMAAARGMRVAAGRFADLVQLMRAGSTLQEQAEELARLGRLEADVGTPEASWRGHDLLDAAANRRLRDLGLPADIAAVATRRSSAPPYGRNTVHMLVADDEDCMQMALALAKTVASDEITEETGRLVRRIAEETGKIVIESPTGFQIGTPVMPDEKPPEAEPPTYPEEA